MICRWCFQCQQSDKYSEGQLNVVLEYSAFNYYTLFIHHPPGAEGFCTPALKGNNREMSPHLDAPLT